jgi:hypothetical protein
LRCRLDFFPSFLDPQKTPGNPGKTPSRGWGYPQIHQRAGGSGPGSPFQGDQLFFTGLLPYNGFAGVGMAVKKQKRF